jgi:hypothetical protein
LELEVLIEDAVPFVLAGHGDQAELMGDAPGAELAQDDLVFGDGVEYGVVVDGRLVLDELDVESSGDFVHDVDCKVL